MALFIFSDLHLGAGNAAEESIKLRKLQELMQIVKAVGARLIILGDLFDFWFEYDHLIPKEHFQVLRLLAEMKESGIEIDYVSGNHDFWLGDFFERQLGIRVHRDAFETEYAGKKLFCLHGDGLAESDRGYRLLKRIFRNRFNIAAYKLLPADWAYRFALSVSGGSRTHTSKRDHEFVEDYRSFAKSKCESGFDGVFIAHLHMPERIAYGKSVYINTGDFITHFTYAKVDASGISLERI